MSSSNCCFLTCIQVSQEAGQVVWDSRLLKNFPRFLVIHTVRGFGVVNKGKVDVFLELSCVFSDPADAGRLIPPLTWLIFIFLELSCAFSDPADAGCLIPALTWLIFVHS